MSVNKEEDDYDSEFVPMLDNDVHEVPPAPPSNICA
jgi:hypothetical protein